MTNILTKAFLKALLPFTISLFGSWIQTILVSHTPRLFNQEASETSFGSKMFDPSEPFDEDLNVLSNDLPSRTGMIANQIEVVGENSYLWFIAMMIILEIIIFGLAQLAIRLSEKRLRQIQAEYDKLSRRGHFQSLCRIHQTFTPQLQKFLGYVVKMMILYSLCYLLYMTVFVALHFAFHSLRHGQKSFAQEILPSNELVSRNLQEVYSNVLEKNEITSTQSPTGRERLLQAPITPSTFTTQYHTAMTAGSILLSRSGTIAFVAILNSVSNCSLQIMDIANRISPKFLGSVSFEMNYKSEYPWGNSLALSADEQLLLMTTGTALRIIDVSGLKSPMVVSSVDLVDQNYYESIQSVTISHDKKFAFLVTYITSVKPRYYIKPLNITDTQSPHFIENLYTSESMIKVWVNGESIAIAGSGGLFLFNISNIHDKQIEPDSFAVGPSEPIRSPFLFQIDSKFEYAYWVDYLEKRPAFNLFMTELGSPNIYSSYFNNADFIGDEQLKSFTEIPIPQSLFLSPTEKFLFLITDQSIMMIDVSNYHYPISYDSISLLSVNCLSISPDEQTLLVGTDDSFYIIQNYFNIQPEEVIKGISLGYNNLGSFATVTDSKYEIYQIALSPDGKTLYELSNTRIILLNVSNPSLLDQLPLNFSIAANQMAISPDGTVLFSISFSSNQASTNFTVYNTSDAQPIFHMSLDNFGYNPYRQRKTIQSFAITPDGNTALIIQSLTNFLILDISNPMNFSVLSNTSYSDFSVVSIALSRDGQTAFIAGISISTSASSTSSSSSLRVYDISIPSYPKAIAEFDQISGVMVSMGLSQNEKIAYMLSEPVDSIGMGSQDICTLNIINISSLSDPIFITSMNLFDNCTDAQLGPQVPMTRDIDVLVVLLEDFWTYINVSNPSSPSLMGSQGLLVQCVTASQDLTTLYVASYQGGTQMIVIDNVLPSNVLVLKSYEISLGSSFTSALNLVLINSRNTYDFAPFDYKFVDLGLYRPTVEIYQNQYSNLPEWISFDDTRSSLTFSPTSPNQIGSYIIYTDFCVQLTVERYKYTLETLGIYVNHTTASHWMAALLELGYLDNELYITSSAEFSDWDDDQESIIKLAFPHMASDYVYSAVAALHTLLHKAVTKITVKPSLELTFSDSHPSSSSSPISITTLSSAPVSIVITLEATGTQPRFVTTNYAFTASFSNNNSETSMVRSLGDVNSALSQLIIFLNGSKYCNGTITVVDGLNPKLNRHVVNISQYFTNSLPPTVDTTYFNNQLGKVFPKTGTQFTVQFDTSTFTDPTHQPLTFKLQMQDSSLQTPDWLEFKEYTLTGTPPEQLTGLGLALKMIVSNQYQSSEVEFTLDVGISLEYALKLIGTYGGGLATVIGLWIYAFTIYNIICKNSYRYPKDFVIKVGQKIDHKTLYPIPFVELPLLESNVIIRHLERKIATQLSSNSKAKIASYFTKDNSWHLDIVKLLKSIQKAVAEIQINDRNALKLYTSYQKDLINDLVINHFVLSLLELDEEKPTKAAFELIKGDLFSLGEFEKPLENGLCRFSVNKSILCSKLRAHDIRIYTPLEGEESQLSEMDPNMNITIESPLTQTKKSIATEWMLTDSNTPIRGSSSANVDLLVEVLEAYALKQHLINAEVVSVDIVVRRRLNKIWLLEGIWRFLKLDLKIAGLSGKTLIGYGIKYKVHENVLVFSGTVNHNAKDTTLVVQIVNRRGKILRELWLYGSEPEDERGPLVQEIL